MQTHVRVLVDKDSVHGAVLRLNLTLNVFSHVQVPIRTSFRVPVLNIVRKTPLNLQHT